MKKIVISLSLLASTLLFSAESYTQFLNTASQDAYEVHDYSKNKMTDMLQSDVALQQYSKKVDDYKAKISSFLEEQTKTNFDSKENAQNALDTLEKLSTQNVQLAKTVAYLASHQTDNANESYNNTLQTTSKTILKLSDDIGVMADRILLMAKEIGIMADRIVKTQEIQSANRVATEKLIKYTMTLTDEQITDAQNNMNAGISNMNMSVNQMQSQQATQGTIQMH